MSLIKKRVAELEARSPAIVPVCHRVIVQPGQTLEEVLADYGRDRIASHDRLIVRTIIDAPAVPHSAAHPENAQ